MILCLDIGNSHIFGGVFQQAQLKQRFRYSSQQVCTSDQFGLFLKTVLRENNIEPDAIQKIAISSVVPSLDYSITAACIKYFNINPLLLKAGIKTGLKLCVKNPLEVGADRIANAIAAADHFESKNVIVVDFGTATTVCVVNAKKEYLGGTIMPGIKIAMQSLHQHAAKLAPVDIVKPNQVLGKTTETNIQSGIYFSQLGSVKEIIRRLKNENFSNQELIVIATGGFAHLFEEEKIFTLIIPDLVLQGLRLVLEKNQ